MCARGRSERSRKERRRSERPVILVVCEGDTEERYFADVKRRFRAQWLEVRNPHCNDPMGLVRQARRMARDLRSKGLDVEPWVVFDAESAAEQGRRKYAEAIAEAGANGVGVANSSPCFEYWVLLHYSAGIVVTEPAEAERELGRSGRVPGFAKPSLPYEELWSIYESGVPSRNASRRRDRMAADGQDPRLGRPVTYVDVLVDRISEIGGRRLG